ncbi:MAG TPA: methyltransferase domain-containing protein [Polyangiaceae bacterium]|nr:methyltransferase domain-containing protein [Polyangiaceae bacterium]
MSEGPSTQGSEVGVLYDEMHALYVAALGDNLHAGYFEGALDTSALEAAQERLTQLMIEHVRLEPQQLLLDVGCGSGRPALRLARDSGGGVLGISVSAAQVHSANARAAAEGLAQCVRFQLADVQSLPFPDASFDAAWALESMLHVADRPRGLAEIRRVTRPGGKLAIADVTVDAPLEPEELAELVRAFRLGRLCSREQYVTELVAAGFDVLSARDIGENTLPTLRAIARRVPALQAEVGSRWQSAQLEAFLRSFTHLGKLRRKLGYVLIAAVRRD